MVVRNLVKLNEATGELTQIGDTLDWSTDNRFGTISLRFKLCTTAERAERLVAKAGTDGKFVKKLKAKIDQAQRDHVLGTVAFVEIHEDALDFVDVDGGLVMRQMWY